MTTHEYAKLLLALEDVPVYQEVYSNTGLILKYEPFEDSIRLTEIPDPVLWNECEERFFMPQWHVKVKEYLNYKESGIGDPSSEIAYREFQVAYEKFREERKQIPRVRCLIQ